MVMQNWLNLLDMGLSATLGRQVAYARGQINGFINFKNLLRSFELIFVIVTLCIAIGTHYASSWLAESWIKSIALNPKDISYCITIMGLIIGLRIFSTIYRSGINGFEDQIWANKTNIFVNTIKYIGSLLIIVFASNDIRHFFEYQFAVGALEAILLAGRFYHNLPSTTLPITWLKIDWSDFQKILPFTLSITYTSALLIAVTQFDKLLLSGILTLEDFGYFSLITLISGSIINLSTPIFVAFLPRLTLLISKKNLKEMTGAYINMTQLITWITFSSAITIINYSEEILYSLTGEGKAYTWGKEILFWYALGSNIFTLGTFQYYLQNAFGTLRLYVIGSTISLAFQVPLIYYITTKYGALEAGKLWCAYSLIWFLGWTALVHKSLIPGFHLKWLIKDILPIVLTTLVLSYALKIVFHIDMNASRLSIALNTTLIGASLLIATSLCVHSIRSKALKILMPKS